jgi:lysozyme
MSRAALLLFVVGCSAPTEDVGSSSAAVTVCGTTTIKGIDVYHGDNGGSTIDWNTVASAGISFAFAKATESTDFTDPMFATNWAGMKSAGLVRGAYHFFHADVDPTMQATYFLGVVGTLDPGDLVALDLETTNGETQATITTNALTFLSAVQSATGIKPILYVSPAFLSSYTSFGSYFLWVANYGVSCPDVPAPWSTYTFWQSTGTGSLSALSGAVDLDSFNGTLAQLQSLVSAPPPPDAGSDASAPMDASSSDGAAPIDSGSDASTAPLGDGATTPPGSEPADDGFPTSSGCAAAPSNATASATWLALGAALVGVTRRRKNKR